MIQSAIYTSDKAISVTLTTGEILSVPVVSDNSDYQLLMKWVSEGNVIQPYVAPPLPTKDERTDNLFTNNDFGIVLSKIIFELVNRVLVLEGSPTITAAQFKTYLKNKLN